METKKQLALPCNEENSIPQKQGKLIVNGWTVCLCGNWFNQTTNLGKEILFFLKGEGREGRRDNLFMEKGVRISGLVLAMLGEDLIGIWELLIQKKYQALLKFCR